MQPYIENDEERTFYAHMKKTTIIKKSPLSEMSVVMDEKMLQRKVEAIDFESRNAL